ncbi:MAG: hypothetical protein ABJN40_16445 [Sneathiella sp.]
MSPLLRKRIFHTFAFLLSALVFTGPITAKADPGAYRCKAEIEKAVGALELGNKTISKMSVVDIYASGIGGSRVEATENWVSFKECKGNLIIRADRSCLIETVYTRGDCTIEGLANY